MNWRAVIQPSITSYRVEVKKLCCIYIRRLLHAFQALHCFRTWGMLHNHRGQSNNQFRLWLAGLCPFRIVLVFLSSISRDFSLIELQIRTTTDLNYHVLFEFADNNYKDFSCGKKRWSCNTSKWPHEWPVCWQLKFNISNCKHACTGSGPVHQFWVILFEW